MKKIYLLAIALLSFVFINGQVLIDTDFSDIDPVPANDENKLANGPYTVTGGEINWHGAKYNDTSNSAQLKTGNLNPNDDPSVQYVRFGSKFTLTDNVPSNHYLIITPHDDFVDGGKLTLTISAHGTFKGINVWDVDEKELLGTIDGSSIPTKEKVEVEFEFPETFEGNKTLAIARAELNGSDGGVTFFLWGIKIETNSPSVGIHNAEYSPVVSTEYYNLSGVYEGADFNALASGLYIKVSVLENGNKTSEKVLKK